MGLDDKEKLIKNVIPCKGHVRSKLYYNFFWWRAELTDYAIEKLKGTIYEEYTHIHLMPYRINESILNQAKENNSKTLPNIDRRTGNIHPDWNEENVSSWFEKPQIEQVVLVKVNSSYYGPLLEKIPKGEKYEKENYIVLKGKKKVNNKFQPYNSIIPLKCFYPPIEDENKSGKKTPEEMVCKLLENIVGNVKGGHEEDAGKK